MVIRIGGFMAEQTTSETEFKIGDKVVIDGALAWDEYGGRVGKTVTGVETEITRVRPGREYPYNTTGDLGWVQTSSLSKVIDSNSTIDVPTPGTNGVAVAPPPSTSVPGTSTGQANNYQVNLNKINTAISNVNNYAREIQQARAKLLSSLEDLKHGWRGASSNAYYRQVVSYLGALDQLEKILRNVAMGLRSAATKVVELDSAAETAAEAINK